MAPSPEPLGVSMPEDLTRQSERGIPAGICVRLRVFPSLVDEPRGTTSLVIGADAANRHDLGRVVVCEFHPTLTQRAHDFVKIVDDPRGIGRAIRPGIRTERDQEAAGSASGPSRTARTFGGIVCAVGWPKPVGMPADLAQALSLVALVAATLQYVILMRHRQERRDATQLNRVATDTGLRGLVRVFLVEP